MNTLTETTPVVSPLVLPVIITKGELARYLGCHVNTLWTTYLKKELLEEWGYNYQRDIKPSHRFSFELTKKIIEHYHIEPLSWYTIVSPHLVSVVSS